MGKSRQYRRNHPEVFRFRKQNRNKKKDRKDRKRGKNRHHLVNKCRGGDCSAENLLVLKREKHDIWHRLFKNSDPEYIIAVLKRLMRMKGYPCREDDSDSVRSPDLPGESRA